MCCCESSIKYHCSQKNNSQLVQPPLVVYQDCSEHTSKSDHQNDGIVHMLSISSSINDDLKIKFRSSVGEKSIDEVAYAGQDAGNIWMGYMPIHSLQNLRRGFDSKSLVITFETFLNTSFECGMCVIYKDDIKPMTGIESWIPDHMESGWVHPDGVRKEDLQHGRWSKPSFCGFENTIEDNTMHVRL